MQSLSPRSSISSNSAKLSYNDIAGLDQEHINLNAQESANTHFQQLEGKSPLGSIKGNNKTVKLILLTSFLLGVSFTWSVELAYGTPYLLSLGLSKALTSLVWLAGPLSGLIMQPIVGVLSDKSNSQYGRRRPFMIVGSLVVAFILILIGWTKEIIFGIFGENSFASTLTIWLAVISIYVLDFAINIVQATSRALIVDCLPPSQQEEGTAWAGKMGVIGSAMGYFMGFVELPAIFPFFGNTNLKVLCILASLVLLSCNALTWWAVKEKVNYDGSQKESISVLSYTFETITSVVKSIRNLPEPVQNICNVQFFAWIGWFPFLIYSTTWVAEVYTRTVGKPSSEVGTRAGSFALLVHSLVSLMASFLLPFIISPSGDTKFTCTNRSHFNWENLRLPLPFLTLPKMWTLSHFIVAFVMLGTWFTNTVAEATFLYGILGISWATAMWAPFSLLGEFIAKNSRQLGTGSLQCNNEVVEPDEISYGLVETTNIQSEEHLVSFTGDYDSSQISCDAGTLLGIHNIYIVLPQFLVTFFSSVVFAIIEPGSEKSLVDEVDVNSNKDAIGFVLRFGGLMALIAGILSIKLWKA